MECGVDSEIEPYLIGIHGVKEFESSHGSLKAAKNLGGGQVVEWSQTPTHYVMMVLEKLLFSHLLCVDRQYREYNCTWVLCAAPHPATLCISKWAVQDF